MEAAVSHVTTIQAGIILNGICNLSGLDELGNTYRTHCIELANRLHWYSAPITATSERSRRCQIYTAWALLCWDSYVWCCGFIALLLTLEGFSHFHFNSLLAYQDRLLTPFRPPKIIYSGSDDSGYDIQNTRP